AHNEGEHWAGSQDIFVHYSSINSSGYHSLREGEYVTFAIERGSRGPQATSVSALGDSLPEDLLRKMPHPAVNGPPWPWRGRAKVVVAVGLVVILAAALVVFLMT
ncbi:MAG: cold-shock protein, partial [Acidimicrobiales bacterium]